VRERGEEGREAGIGEAALDPLLPPFSGAAAVDAILGGGIETRCITEVYGEYR
jgi:RecA/RadA recombinase